MSTIKRVLCPVDFSESALKALDMAVFMSKSFDADLIVMHVVQPVPVASVQAPSPAFDIEVYYRELVNAAEDKLDGVVDKAVPDEMKPRKIVVQGKAADEIVETGHKEDVDLIVMGTHGESGWRRFVYGSVAQKILQLAERPVLAVPVKREE